MAILPAEAAEMEAAPVAAPPPPAPARPPGPAARTLSAQTRRLLEDPVGATVARLAAPNALAMGVQTVMNVAETWYVGRLGTAALAGYALVFPLVRLMEMITAGAMGGGINAAIARALGAGDRGRAQALVIHAMAIALALGAAIAALALGLGPALFRLLGGRGEALAAAGAYAGTLFAGAVLVCLSNAAASVWRGTGRMEIPAGTMLLMAAVQLPLAGALTLGWGPFPRLGLAGTAIAYLVAFGIGAVVQVGLLLRRGDGRSLRLVPARLRAPLFGDILRVGALASISPVQTVLTVVVTTGIAGGFGTAALAGYGIGARLELMMIPIIFGIGTALVATVGANLGAGQVARARRAAWGGSVAAGAIVGAIGAAAAVFPEAWAGLFTEDPGVAAAASAYLRTVGPCYLFLGLGTALYFASQGAGSVLWPVVAGTVRLVVAAGGGWLAVRLASGVGGLFLALAVAMVAFGAVTAAAVGLLRWGRPV